MEEITLTVTIHRKKTDQSPLTGFDLVNICENVAHALQHSDNVSNVMDAVTVQYKGTDGTLAHYSNKVK